MDNNFSINRAVIEQIKVETDVGPTESEETKNKSYTNDGKDDSIVKDRDQTTSININDEDQNITVNIIDTKQHKAVQTFIQKYNLLVNKACSSDADICIRSSISTVKEAELFAKFLFFKTQTVWKVSKNKNESHRIKYLKRWVCQYTNDKRPRSMTGCRARFSVLILKPCAKETDCFLRLNPPLCTVIRMHTEHNHCTAEDTSIPEELIKIFFKYFDKGYGVDKAFSLYKESLKNNNAMQLSLKKVCNLHSKWMDQKIILSDVCCDRAEEDLLTYIDMKDLLNSIPRSDPPLHLKKPQPNPTVRQILESRESQTAKTSIENSELSELSKSKKTYSGLPDSNSKKIVFVKVPSTLAGTLRLNTSNGGVNISNIRTYVPILPKTVDLSTLVPQNSATNLSTDSSGVSRILPQRGPNSSHRGVISSLINTETSPSKTANDSSKNLPQLDSESESDSDSSTEKTPNPSHRRIIPPLIKIQVPKMHVLRSSNKVAYHSSQNLPQSESDSESESDSVNSTSQNKMPENDVATSVISSDVSKSKQLKMKIDDWMQFINPEDLDPPNGHSTTSQSLLHQPNNSATSQDIVSNIIKCENIDISDTQCSVASSKVRPFGENTHCSASPENLNAKHLKILSDETRTTIPLVQAELVSNTGTSNAEIIKVKEEPPDDYENHAMNTDDSDTSASTVPCVISSVSSMSGSNKQTNDNRESGNIQPSHPKKPIKVLPIISKSIISSSPVKIPNTVSVMEDYNFLMSLLPELRQVPPNIKSKVKNQIKELVHSAKLQSCKNSKPKSNVHYDCRTLPTFPSFK